MLFVITTRPDRKFSFNFDALTFDIFYVDISNGNNGNIIVILAKIKLWLYCMSQFIMNK